MFSYFLNKKLENIYISNKEPKKKKKKFIKCLPGILYKTKTEEKKT